MKKVRKIEDKEGKEIVEIESGTESEELKYRRFRQTS